MTVPLILKVLTDRLIWKKKQKQKSKLFLTKQCSSSRYKVSLLSTCGGCLQEGFIFASFYNFKYIANNHDNNNNNNCTNNNKLSRFLNFHLHIFLLSSVNFPVSIFPFC